MLDNIQGICETSAFFVWIGLEFTISFYSELDILCEIFSLEYEINRFSNFFENYNVNKYNSNLENLNINNSKNSFSYKNNFKNSICNSSKIKEKILGKKSFYNSSWKNIDENLNVFKKSNSILLKNNTYQINYDQFNINFYENDKLNFELFDKNHYNQNLINLLKCEQNLINTTNYKQSIATLNDLIITNMQDGALNWIINNNTNFKDYKNIQEEKLKSNLNYTFNLSFGKKFLGLFDIRLNED